MSVIPGRPASTTEHYGFPVPGGLSRPDYLTYTGAFADAIDAKFKELLEVEPWHYVGQPGEPPFGENWRNDPMLGGVSGFVNASFRRYPSGEVMVRGTVSVLQPSTSTATIFVLPVGYRPAAPMVFATDLAKVGVSIDGAVVAQPNPTQRMSMNLQFPAEVP